MNKRNDSSAEGLRHRAEARLKKDKQKRASPATQEELQRLVHELEVHQVELEIQNEELQQVRAELEASLERYTELYDFAPVAYFTLGRDGTILQANLTGSKLLEVDRSNLANKRFDFFIIEKDRSFFSTFLEKVFQEMVPKTCEVAIYNKKEQPCFVLVEARPAECGRLCLIAGFDITQRKQDEYKLTEYAREMKQLNHLLDTEIDKARRVHERSLPKALPAIQGISIAAHYQPARKLGGDFYDVIHKDNKLIIYLSDVTGHGLDNAILSAFVKEAVQGYITLKDEELTPGKILQYLNLRYRSENFPEDYFIAIFLSVLDLDTLEFTYSCAGLHSPPLVRLTNFQYCELINPGPPISQVIPIELYSFEEKHIVLSSGSTILFNTDGLIEQSVQKEIYGSRVNFVFQENSHLSPEAIVQSITKDFSRFNNGSLQGDDDVTLLVIQVN